MKTNINEGNPRQHKITIFIQETLVNNLLKFHNLMKLESFEHEAKHKQIKN